MITDLTNPNPLLNANQWSHLFFNWLSPLLKQGRRQGTLTQDDLYELPDELNSLNLTEELEANWLDEVKDPTKIPSLLRATFRSIRRKVFLISLLMIPQALVSIGQPLTIVFLIDFFDPCSTMKISTVWILVFVNILIIWFPCVFYHQHSAKIRCLGMQMRTAYSDLIFRKMLRLSNGSMNDIGLDGIKNLVSNDVSKIETALIYLDYLWRTPIEIILIIGFFSYFVKYICLIVLGYTIIGLLFHLLISRVLVRLRSKTFQVTNERVKITSEIIKSIGIVKVCCWELAFMNKILSIRKQEMIRYVYCIAVNCITQTFNYTYTAVTFFLMYLTMWSLNISLDTRFFALCSCLIGYMQYGVMDFLFEAIRNLIEYMAAEKRIQKFLLLAECKRDERLLSQPVLALAKAKNQKGNMFRNDPDRPLKIVCQLKSARWDENSLFALKNIVFEAHPRNLICVIGPVGSGKTSLLHALSGEIAHFSGKIRMYGTCCYVPQESWIFSSTIKENILFGQDYDHLLFKRVIHAVALEIDLKQLLHGAETIIDDQNTILTESQKARVSLARALYRNADIYLLDNPLSAVDAKISKHLFEKSIKGYLRHKICILVTHETQFLKYATKIIEMNEGEIVHIGTYVKLRTSSTSSSFCRQLDGIGDDEEKGEDMMGSDKRFSLGNISLSDLKVDESLISQSVPNMEGKREGIIRWQTYVEFVKAAVGLIIGFVIFVFTFCLREGIFVYNSWWLAKWTDDENYRYEININCTNITTDEQVLRIKLMTDSEWKIHRNYRFHIYAILFCALFLITLCRTFVTQFICLNASRILHNRMFQCIIHCPVSVFDANSIDKSILNRFIKDITIMDSVLPDLIHELLHFICYVLGTIALVGWVNPWSLIATGLAAVATIFVRNRFVQCLHDLRRIENSTRSYVYSHLTSSINGIKVIRSYRAEEICSDMFRQHLDMNNRANHLIIMINRWAGLRFDWIACSFSTLIILSAMIVHLVGKHLSAADIGLIFSYGFNLIGLFQWTIRLSAIVRLK
ncbi:hypothetical protein I4U23_015269 [Adineta vaga]|nr:hypothetical protein I4U23_015269 [Adineta vaga]